MTITYRPAAKFDQQATVVLMDEEQIKTKRLALMPKAYQEEILALGRFHQFSGESEQMFPLMVKKRLVLLVGIGKKEGINLTALRTAVRKALLSSYIKPLKNIEVVVHEQKDSVIEAVIEGILIGGYSWKKYRTKLKTDKTVDEKNIVLAAARKKNYEDTVKTCAGIHLARDLINDNADTVTSEYFEKIVRGLIKGRKNISLELLNRRELKAKGLSLHLAVNQASRKEPKLIIVTYKGGASKGDYTAIVGKGMTFDTGGLNLKPSGNIETMRLDMSGAAAVVGILKNVLALNLRRNVIFACALAENAIGSEAYKPGDVIKSYAGKTVEIGNTDAEGRLVLADAMAYLVKNYKPARIVDIATLTGACIIALGHDYTGLVSSDDKLAGRLMDSAHATDDRLWRLPLYPELKEAVKSQIADIKNIGFPKGAAGVITAAEFLHQFAGDTPWAHLDIAGTAFVDNRERMYFGHGGTGAGVRLLTHYLKNN